MDKTPIQTILDGAISAYEKMPDGHVRGATQLFIDQLYSLLPYEKQWAEEMFEAGSNWYEDNEDNLRYKLDNPLTDFKTLYSKYEK